MGAIITVHTDRMIRIEGVDGPRRLHPPRPPGPHRGGVAGPPRRWRPTATSSSSGATPARHDDLPQRLPQGRRRFDIDDDGIRFCHPGGELNPLALETDVHPGFMTDWQQPLVVALTQAEGCRSSTRPSTRTGSASPTRSTRWAPTSRCTASASAASPCRFGQRNFLHSAVISGPDASCTGADLDVPDLRGGFSHLIAALAAEGTLAGSPASTSSTAATSTSRRSSPAWAPTSTSPRPSSGDHVKESAKSHITFVVVAGIVRPS